MSRIDVLKRNYTSRGEEWHILKALKLMGKQGGSLMPMFGGHLVQAIVDGSLESVLSRKG
jgi:hypothetical protein